MAEGDAGPGVQIVVEALGRRDVGGELRDQVAANARRLKAGTDKLEKDDISAGLTAVVTVRLPEPQFEGQTKEVLGTPAATALARPCPTA